MLLCIHVCHALRAVSFSDPDLYGLHALSGRSGLLLVHQLHKVAWLLLVALSSLRMGLHSWDCSVVLHFSRLRALCFCAVWHLQRCEMPLPFRATALALSLQLVRPPAAFLVQIVKLCFSAASYPRSCKLLWTPSIAPVTLS